MEGLIFIFEAHLIAWLEDYHGIISIFLFHFDKEFTQEDVKDLKEESVLIPILVQRQLLEENEEARQHLPEWGWALTKATKRLRSTHYLTGYRVERLWCHQKLKMIKVCLCFVVVVFLPRYIAWLLTKEEIVPKNHLEIVISSKEISY